MLHKRNLKLAGIVSDLDGVLWVKEDLAPDAINTIQMIRENNIPFCVLTNDCLSSARQRIEQLASNGLVIDLTEMITAPLVAKKWLHKNSIQTIYYLGSRAVLEDLHPLVIVGNSSADTAQAIVVGDLFNTYDRADIEIAARLIIKGLPFIAMQKKPLWSDGKNWFVDNGFWVAGLEYVTKRDALIMGKPSYYSYQVARDALNLQPNQDGNVLMLSDDIAVDLFGAKDTGMNTVYVGPIVEPIPEWLDGQVTDLNGFMELARQAITYGK